MATTAQGRKPAHLWIVGILGVLWNGFGACDYLMSRTHNVGWMKSMMPDADATAMFNYIDSMPIYASAGWGLGVWCSLLGSGLLLARSRYAVPVFLLSVIGAVVSFGYQMFVATNVPPEMAGPMVPIVITVLITLQLLYARAMAARGVLR